MPVSNSSIEEVRCCGKTCSRQQVYKKWGQWWGWRAWLSHANLHLIYSVIGWHFYSEEWRWQDLHDESAVPNWNSNMNCSLLETLWKANGKVTNRLCSAPIMGRGGGGIGSQISKVRHNGLASKAVHTPTETTKPCSCNFRNTHVYKSSNWTPNYPSEAVCLGFSQVPEALVIFGFGNRV